MNILLINHYAGAPALGMEHRPYQLAREWVRSGHRVTVVAGTFSHLRVRNPSATESISETMIDGIRYVWLRTPRYNGNGLQRVRSMASFVAQLYRRQKRLMAPPPDVVIASSTYPFDIYPARAIARRARARLVFEVHDLWPSTPIELGGFSRAHPFIVAMQLAENAACRADRIVSLLPGALSYYASKGVRPEHFAWVPNGLDLTESEAVPLPGEHLAVLEEARKTHRMVVGYAGSHGVSNKLEILLQAAELTRGDEIAYVLMGTGPAKPALERFVRERGLVNVFFLPPVSRGAVGSFLAQIDAAYLGWNRSSLYRFGISPNKLLDYMAAGCPVIHGVEAFNDPVADANCGISVPPEDPDAVALAARRLAMMSADERRALGSRGAIYVRECHDNRKLAADFLDFVCSEPRINGQ